MKSLPSIRIAFFQMDILWHQPRKNCVKIEEILRRQRPEMDFLVLPEMFTSGFTMQPELVAEEMQGASMQWMQKIAREYHCIVMGSLVIREGRTYRNRFVAIAPEAPPVWYDKKHLFTLAGEDACYEKGNRQVIFHLNGWQVMPLICYDLRFPVWSYNTCNYDLLLYVANWPAPRIAHWLALLRARAIENQSYVIGVNRTGIDDNGLVYTGRSAAFDYAGNCIIQAENEEILLTVTLDYQEQAVFRSTFQFLADHERFSLDNTDFT